jgi:hypothetical protein
MAGNVYVFNLYVENASSFGVNEQGSAGTISAPSGPPWTPSALVVPRTNAPRDQLTSPMFAVGDNDIGINYAGQDWMGVVNIPAPPDVRFEDDLWLYLAYAQAFLFKSTGELLPDPRSGGAISLTEI